jgi:biopolymer transport protein ExbD
VIDRTLLLAASLSLLACHDGDRTRDCVRSFAAADLPVIGGGEDKAQELWIEITSEGRLTVNGMVLGSGEELHARAQIALHRNPALRAWISADEGVSYAALMQVIDQLKQAGVSRMAFGYPAAGEQGL